MTTIHSDMEARRRALTDHASTLLVEAAAGTGKTALIAGRITLLLAEGCEPGQIAAITFMEAAAADLSARVHRYVADLLEGRVPMPLKAVLSQGLTPGQQERLQAASASLNELTASTIHGFCQSILSGYAIEADIDPGAQVIDATQANIAFDTVFEHWFRRRLSGSIEAADPIAILAREDPKHVLTTVRELAHFRRRHRTARPVAADLSGRPDIEFIEAVRELRCWSETAPKQKDMEALLAALEALAAHYADSFQSVPDFSRLWYLAHPPQLPIMLSDKSYQLKVPRLKAAWQRLAGADEGAKLNDEAIQRFGRVDSAYRTLLGKVATALVANLSKDVDEVVDGYRAFKRAAAVLDFDDLLYNVRDLVVRHEDVRIALGKRYAKILVDEFQDTDPLQAEILFRIGAVAVPADWAEAELRPGALFFVGDPKQAIFGFRGADIEAYGRAKRAIGEDSLLHVTASFRSLPGIVSHVNECFAQPLNAPGQPGYAAMTSTRTPAPDGQPSVAKLTIHFPEHVTDPRSNEVRDAEAQAVAHVCAMLVGNMHVTDQGQRRALRLDDIALLTPADTELWRYEQALDDRGLPYASQAGKNLLDRQEIRDLLAVARVLADADDTLAFGTLMRGPLVGLSEEELLDITEQLPPVAGRTDVLPRFSLRTDPAHVAHALAREVLTSLRVLWGASSSTTPRLLLSDALERLSIRSILALRDGERSNRALANIDLFLDLARAYDVRGIKQFVADGMRDWAEEVPRNEGRVESIGQAIHIVTMHSSKGLEWPVVIPINTVTWRHRPDAFVYRSSDNTMHWVLREVVPPDLHAAMQGQHGKDAREYERLYYVAFTRAKDLLVLPKIPPAGERAWSSTIPDPHRDIQELDLSGFSLQPLPRPAAEPNNQTAEIFAQQQGVLRASRRPLSWLRPSQDDLDRLQISDVIVSQDEEPSELANIVGAGRMRGLLLHKLMEEVLSGETPDEVSALAVRARELMEQLAQGRELRDGPRVEELAATVHRTLSIPEIARLRPNLLPELGVYGTLAGEDCVLVSGRVDAIYVENSEPQIAVDWKSDVSPSASDIEMHSAQLYMYMKTSMVARGVVVYMSTSKLRWLET